MSEQAPREPVTDVERGLLDVIRHLQVRWAETLGDMLQHSLRMRDEMGKQIAALTQEVHELSEQIKELRSQLTKDRLF